MPNMGGALNGGTTKIDSHMPWAHRFQRTNLLRFSVVKAQFHTTIVALRSACGERPLGRRLFAGFHLVDHVDSSLVTPAFEIFPEEHFRDHLGFTWTDDTRTQSNRVGIIVVASQLGRVRL